MNWGDVLTVYLWGLPLFGTAFLAWMAREGNFHRYRLQDYGAHLAIVGLYTLGWPIWLAVQVWLVIFHVAEAIWDAV